MVVAVNVLFILLALVALYFVLVVPLYNYVTRHQRSRRDGVILIFLFLFTAAIMQILWSIHSDIVQLVR